MDLNEISFQKTDWVAIIRAADENTLAWEPVFVRQSDGACFIKRYGKYEAAESVTGFVKYERVKPLPTKKLYDPNRGTLVDTGIPVAEYEEAVQ